MLLLHYAKGNQKNPTTKKEEKQDLPMCSHNTSNSVDGHASSAANASAAPGDSHHDYASSSFRKPKKPRIPKRGPGVAELEKILREQENKHGEEKEKISIGRISSSFVPLPKTTYLRPRSSNVASSSHPLSRTVPPFSDHSHLADTLSTPLTTLPAGNFNANDNLKGSSQFGGGSRSKAVYIYKAGIYLPEEALLPVPWGSYETSKGEETPKTDSDFSFPVLVSKGMDHSKTAAPPMFQNSEGPSHSSMMNEFPWSAVSSSSRPSSSAGVHLEEPPSSQKSCHSHTSTVLSEEDKMIGAKRPRPIFPVDNWPPAPPSTSPCQHSSFDRHIHRLDPSSSSSHHGVINLATSSRDPILPNSSLERKLQKCVNDHENPSGSSIAFRSPTTPLPSTETCKPDFSKFKQFSFQEMKENSVERLLHQNPSSSSAGSEGSVHKKSFISFLLEPGEQSGDAAAEATLSGLIFEKFAEEEGAGFIDLNLKL